MNNIVKASAQPPALNDADLAASLQQHGGLKLAERRVVLQGQPELIATALTTSKPNFRWSISLLQRALEPATTERLEQALATLSVLIAKRASEEDEAELQLAVYAARLRAYPADVAMRVLSEWPSRSRFWPTWCELESELNRLVRWRTEALAAVQLAAAGEQPEAPVKKTPDVAKGLRALGARLRAVADAADEARDTAVRKRFEEGRIAP